MSSSQKLNALQAQLTAMQAKGSAAGPGATPSDSSTIDDLKKQIQDLQQQIAQIGTVDEAGQGFYTLKDGLGERGCAEIHLNAISLDSEQSARIVSLSPPQSVRAAIFDFANDPALQKKMASFVATGVDGLLSDYLRKHLNETIWVYTTPEWSSGFGLQTSANPTIQVSPAPRITPQSAFNSAVPTTAPDRSSTKEASTETSNNRAAEIIERRKENREQGPPAGTLGAASLQSQPSLNILFGSGSAANGAVPPAVLAGRLVWFDSKSLYVAGPSDNPAALVAIPNSAIKTIQWPGKIEQDLNSAAEMEKHRFNPDARSIRVERLDKAATDFELTYTQAVPSWRVKYRVVFDPTQGCADIEAWALIANRTAYDWGTDDDKTTVDLVQGATLLPLGTVNLKSQQFGLFPLIKQNTEWKCLCSQSTATVDANAAVGTSAGTTVPVLDALRLRSATSQIKLLQGRLDVVQKTKDQEQLLADTTIDKSLTSSGGYSLVNYRTSTAVTISLKDSNKPSDFEAEPNALTKALNPQVTSTYLVTSTPGQTTTYSVSNKSSQTVHLVFTPKKNSGWTPISAAVEFDSEPGKRSVPLADTIDFDIAANASCVLSVTETSAKASDQPFDLRTATKDALSQFTRGDVGLLTWIDTLAKDRKDDFNKDARALNSAADALQTVFNQYPVINGTLPTSAKDNTAIRQTIAQYIADYRKKASDAANQNLRQQTDVDTQLFPPLPAAKPSQTPLPPSPGQTLGLPDHNQLYHGVNTFPQSGDSPSFSAFEATSYEAFAGQATTIINVPNYWSKSRAFPKNDAKRAWQLGKIPYIKLWLQSDDYVPPKNPKEAPQTPERTFTLEAINKGTFDDDLKKWGKDATEFGNPIVAEYGSECNGFWSPWNCWKGNTYDFKKAYTHIIDTIKAPNITWVFHVNYNDNPPDETNHFEHYYPDGDRIQWLGVSVYGPQKPGDAGSDSFTSLMGPAYTRLIKLDAAKPVFVCEFGINGRAEMPVPPGPASVWTEDALKSLFDKKSKGEWKQLLGFCWWNEHWINDCPLLAKAPPTCQCNRACCPDTDMRIQDCAGLSKAFTDALEAHKAQLAPSQNPAHASDGGSGQKARLAAKPTSKAGPQLWRSPESQRP